MKFVLRALCLPLVAICYIIKWIAILTIKCSSYILAPMLWFIGACCVYTVIKQQWDQTLLLLIVGSAGVLLIASIVVIAVVAQNVAITLQNL